MSPLDPGTAARARASQAPYVLVVEDDADLRGGLRDLLAGEGHAVVTAQHGAVAIAHLRAHPPPCVILLDMMMPVMDGATFAAAYLADVTLAHAPLVVLSAVADMRRMRPLVDAVAWLRKPIDDATLLAVVARCIPPCGGAAS